jgi:hypothetical protein
MFDLGDAVVAAILRAGELLSWELQALPFWEPPPSGRPCARRAGSHGDVQAQKPCLIHAQNPLWDPKGQWSCSQPCCLFYFLFTDLFDI